MIDAKGFGDLVAVVCTHHELESLHKRLSLYKSLMRKFGITGYHQ
jgi:hypothetical protein